MKKATQNILKYGIEFLIVGFGVFLGMYVTEWRTEKKLAENAERSIAYIAEELNSNAQNLEKAIAYHESIKKAFDSAIDTLTEEDLLEPYYSNEKFRHSNLKGWTGIGLPDFEDVAFESSKIIGTIQEIDIDLIHSISKVYKHQEFNAEIGKSTLDRMIATNSTTRTVDVISIFELLTSDLLNHERWLKQQLYETIKKIKERYTFVEISINR